MSEFIAKVKAFFLNIVTSLAYKDKDVTKPRFASLVDPNSPSDLNLFGKIVYWVLVPLVVVALLFFGGRFILKKFKKKRYTRRRKRATARRTTTRKRSSTRAGKRKFSSMRAKMAWVRSQRKKKPKRKK